MSARRPIPDPLPGKELARLRRELKKALAALAAQETAARRQTEDAVNRERRRFADALHRTASQSLTAAYYLSVVLARQPSVDQSPHAADLAALPDLIHKAVDELRAIMQEFSEPGR